MTDDAVPTSKLFTALDHYNSAAASLHQIAEKYEEPDFGIADATLLLNVANTHALLGLLKLGITDARFSGRME
jgi:hypothetical protein